MNYYLFADTSNWKNTKYVLVKANDENEANEKLKRDGRYHTEIIRTIE